MATPAEMARVEQLAMQSDVSLDELIWSSQTCERSEAPSSDLLAFAAEKRKEMDVAWDRVTKKTETLFALSVGGCAWVLTHVKEMGLTRWQAPWCAAAYGLPVLLCVIAWWGSGKPCVAMRQMIDSPAKTAVGRLWNICTATALVERRMARSLRCKQGLNKAAAVLLILAVTITAFSCFLAARA